MAIILMSLTACGAFALEEQEPGAIVLAQADVGGAMDRNRPQLEVSSSSLPRFDNTDGSSRRATRVDMTLLQPRRSALGLSLGMTSADASYLAASNSSASSPSSAGFGGATNFMPNKVDLGLTWRYTLDSNYRFDVTAWRRVEPADALTLIQTRQPTYGARVEMRLGGTLPKGGFVAERGFLGLQLESGARVTLRRNGGKPMVYYRTKF